MDFVNLTPHPITLIDEETGDSVILEPRGEAARIEEQPTFEKTMFFTSGQDVIITSVAFSNVVGLPKPKRGTAYIVSLLVAWAHPLRKDLVFPYPLIRDESGRVIGCSGFGMVAKHDN